MLPDVADAGPATSGMDAHRTPERARAVADSAAQTIDWRVLGLLDYRSTAIPPAVQRIDGQRVRIPGFIVPLEDFQERAKEFLLVPYFGACVHMPPPPPNQMVFVRMSAKTSLSMWGPVWVEGRLEVTKVESPYGAVSYRMAAERLTPYRTKP